MSPQTGKKQKAVPRYLRENYESHLGPFSFSYKLAARIGELHALQSRVDIVVSERDELSIKLKCAQAELDEIKRSFGYKLMRFYGPRIDRLLPDSTRRGEFKRIVVRTLRIAATEGIRSLIHRTWERLERGELRVAEPPPNLERPRVLLYCDYPPLSETEVAEVSDLIMVTGWAVSEKGIREVRLYLDGNLLGAASYGIGRPDLGRAFPDFPDSDFSGFCKMIDLEGNVREGPHTLRVVAESNDWSTAAVEGLVDFAKTTLIDTLAYEDLEDKGESIKTKPSVIVPTKSPPADFEQALERIRNQEGVEDPEIIIMNSGAEDLSHFAERYGAKIFNFPPEEFTPGRIRNYGAEQATGDYVFFMTDDAIPASNFLLRDMIKVFERDRKLAAVTARHIPRTDADLMACKAVWGHYQMLRLHGDKVVSSPDVDSLRPEEKIRLCHVDNVCSCFRRDIVLKYRFDEHAHWEDIDVGIRLVRDGFSLAQLYSIGVIHSHTRSPFFYLKRTYADVDALFKLSVYTPTEFEQYGVYSLDDLLDYILDLYDSVCSAVDDLRDSDFSERNISKAFQTIEKRLTAGIAISPRSSNQDLSEALSRIAKIARHSRGCLFERNPLRQGYLLSLGAFEEWLRNTHRDLRDLEGGFVEALYKFLGVEIGGCLGRHYVYQRLSGRLEERITQLDKFLREGLG